MIALKRYGQNFLVDRNILACMIERSCLSESDCVLEIGPGHGVLTRGLLAQGVRRVDAVELDQRLRPELEELASCDKRLVLHWCDALKFDYASLAEPFPNKIIANIPYNITTPLIWKLLKFSSHGLRYHLYMLQKEAALRLAAPPDTKARYPLGVTVEATGRAVIVRNVSRSCFRPVPEVNSALVEIVTERNFNLACDVLWSELLHRGFAHRRKTLGNNLSGFHEIKDWSKISGVNMSARAEDLTCNEWLELYEGIKKFLRASTEE